MVKNTHRCFVFACANNVHVNPNVIVFRLPRASEKLMKWLSAVSKFAPGIPSISDPNEALKYSSKFICANHFIESDFVNEKKNKLNHHVLPSVFDATLASSSSPKVTTESVVQPSEFQYKTNLSPSSPHVLHVKHAYSKISTMPNAEDNSTNCGSFHSIVSNSIFLPSTSSTPVCPPKARCRLQMTDPGMCSTSGDEVSEELAVQLIDTTVESVQKPLNFKSKKSRPIGTTLLKTCGVSRMSMLTPKKQKLLRQVQGKVKAMKRVCKQLRKQNLTFRETVEKAADLQLRELKNMSPAAYHLLASQLRFKNMKPQGRRWAVDEKIVALSIYKRSPSCYSLLRRMLVLPSKKSLLNLLNAVPFKCGVDNRVMLLIKEIVSSLSSLDRYCVLMFDEMSLKEHFQYCPKEDKIIGLVDNGKSRCADLANYAMVFMLRGLRKKWKQPVACYFTHGCMKGGELKVAVEEVLSCSFAVGLNVVATVCDMGTNNVSALKQLGAKFPEPVFQFSGREIAVMFDPPHLLKCTRNMFLSHIVRGVNVRGELPITGAARWEHVEKMYEEDKKSIFRLAPKVTDGHLAPTSSERMKVSTAAQVMSHSVAAAIHSFVSRDILPPEATVTASFVADVDELFDSFNGADRYPDAGKPLRCCLSESSPHLEYWQEKAKSLVHNWQFCTDPNSDGRLRRERKEKPPPLRPGKKRCTVSRPPSQWGWITSINAVIHIWNVVSEAGFSYLQQRTLNQDPLENLFGLIRSYCGANSNPTCVQFGAALKTAIVNGLAFKSFSGNCQKDDASILNDLRAFLVTECQEREYDSSSDFTKLSSDMYDSAVTGIDRAVETGDASILSSAYVAGFIAHKLLGKVKCDKCKMCLLGSNIDFHNTGVSFKEYSNVYDCLTYPSQNLVTFVAKFANIFEEFMVVNSHIDNLLMSLSQHVLDIVRMPWLEETDCEQHTDYLRNGIVKAAAEISIRWWCKRMNRKLIASKKIKQQSRKISILTHM